MDRSSLLVAIVAFAFGSQFSAQAEDVQVDANMTQVAALIPVKPEFTLEKKETLLDVRYVHCDYNFLGRILIRNGRFYLGVRGKFVPQVGLLIESVEQNSPADRAGLAAGMIITSLNGERPDNRSRFERGFEKFDGIVELTYKPGDELPAEDSSDRDLKFDLRAHFIASN